jgi:MarR family transcriptional regulator, organic hydroperoxide resistance regulator
MTANSRRDQLNAEILESVSELIGRVIGHGEQLAQKLSIPAPFIKALHTMDCPMAMKELGKRMHCDPSFVTLVADMLEKRGLARREPHPADRRVKNLVLTEDGVSLKKRLETEISARMPWNRALNDDERAQLLALIRKMLSAEDNGAGAPDMDASAAAILTAAGIDPLGTIKEVLSTGKQEPAAQVDPNSPPAKTGEVSSVVSKAAHPANRDG